MLALPLGLGKANHIVNALYDKAAADPSIKLTIFTALTLKRRTPRTNLSAVFSIRSRSAYLPAIPRCIMRPQSMKTGFRPTFEINEFFFEAGEWLGSPYAQQHYISANYTDALSYVLDRGVNVVGQLVAHRAEETARPYSLSCNPDLTSIS